MTVEELKFKHFDIPDQAYRGSEQHSKISIEFAISVLENLELCNCDDEYVQEEIKKLKKELQ